MKSEEWKIVGSMVSDGFDVKYDFGKMIWDDIRVYGVYKGYLRGFYKGDIR